MRVLLPLLALMAGGCIQKLATNALANTLSGDGAGAFTVDDDVQFVGEAIPFALKLMESIRDAAPKHDGIRATLCSSYTQYAVLYVSWPAQQAYYDDYDAYLAGQARARKFLRRANADCMDAFDLRHPGFSEQLKTDHDAALAQLGEDDLTLLYWTGANQLATISLSKEDPAAIGTLPTAAAMVHRALAIDPDWDKGAIHDLLIQVEPSLPMPGGVERARDHFDRAVALHGGTRAGSYVSLATTVSVWEQNRTEFEALLNRALEVDASAIPADQLANLYAQEQARFYLDHADELFLE